MNLTFYKRKILMIKPNKRVSNENKFQGFKPLETKTSKNKKVHKQLSIKENSNEKNKF